MRFNSALYRKVGKRLAEDDNPWTPLIFSILAIVSIIFFIAVIRMIVHR